MSGMFVYRYVISRLSLAFGKFIGDFYQHTAHINIYFYALDFIYQRIYYILLLYNTTMKN